VTGRGQFFTRLFESLDEGETGTYNGLKVYGPRPPEDAIMRRLKGRKPVKGLEKVTGTRGFGSNVRRYEYYVEVWIDPEDGQAYRSRRDGRIQISMPSMHPDDLVWLK
jgi:hypothetical protein